MLLDCKTVADLSSGRMAVLRMTAMVTTTTSRTTKKRNLKSWKQSETSWKRVEKTGKRSESDSKTLGTVCGKSIISLHPVNSTSEYPWPKKVRQTNLHLQKSLWTFKYQFPFCPSNNFLSLWHFATKRDSDNHDWHIFGCRKLVCNDGHCLDHSFSCTFIC